jgi:alpha-L-fucosidase
MKPLRLLTLLAITSPLLAEPAFSPAAPTSPAAEPRAPDIATLTLDPVAHAARMSWWREARFGMFVHWGVSAHLAGSWNGREYPSYGEHIQRVAKIPVSVYHDKVAGVFNPTAFDADTWVRLAKETGMGYFIITAKHHDGFAMFDTQVSPWDVVDATPWGKDPMKDLAAACRKHGVKFGFYYSHAFDWGEQNGSGNDWDWPNPGGDKLLHGSDWWINYPEFLPKICSYVDQKAIPQILELINNYQPDILWFDTPHKIPPEENLRIFAAVRKAGPGIVVNGRIFPDTSPELLALADYINTGDKPGVFAPQPGDWEGIPTTNDSYGYKAKDLNHKPPGHFIRLLAKASARGGNLLLNMGPRGDGSVDPLDLAIFQGIGTWWRINGEAIKGTTRTPLPRQTWDGESTLKGDAIYLHVFGWPKNGELLVSGLKTDIKAVRLLDHSAAPSAKLTAKRLNEFDWLLTGLPATAPDAINSVIALECASAPVADTAQLLLPTLGKNTLQGLDSTLTAPAKYRAGRGADDAWVVNWTNNTAAVTWSVRVTETCTFDATFVYDASEGAKKNRLVEGDAGRELARADSGAGGTYTVTINGQTLEHIVTLGRPSNQPLGCITLPPGHHEIRVSAKDVTGEELFRLRRLILDPVKP